MTWRPDKLILTDIDGVCLDWEYGFDNWMSRHGYRIADDSDYQMSVKYDINHNEAKRLIRMFNESAWIRRLTPLRDAIHYIKKLHQEHGYVFHCITSMSRHENATKLRQMNLEKLFGETRFAKFIFLDTSADKDEVLKAYEGTGCWWIEDNIRNAQAGLKLGLMPLLMEHGHNMDYEDPAIPRVKNWREVFETIVN